MSVDLPRKGRYRHFKGGEYEVIGVARHSETDEPLVIYRALYPCPDTPNGEGIWARPLSSWNAPAEVEGKAVPRFAPIADEAPLPELVRVIPILAAVAGPTRPSAVRPYLRWNCFTAAWVCAPYTPSALPVIYPH